MPDSVQGQVLAQGRIVTPRGVVQGRVRAAGGVITAVERDDGRSPADSPGPGGFIDAGDSYIIPGAVDAHVHCLSSPHEGIEATTRSALAGGVTTIVEMPYDHGNPITDAGRLRAKRALAEQQAHADMALLATVRPVGGAAEVEDLVAAGAAGFKLSLFDTDPRRFPRVPDVELLDVLSEIERCGSIACFHAENDEIIKPLIERFRAEGRTGPLDHCASRPPISETEAVLRAAEYSLAAGCRAHFCHLSLARSVGIVSCYAEAGLDATVETCPHYLAFAAEDMSVAGSRLKINPPLRDLEDSEALWDAVARGTVDVVASDHAPWPLSEKVLPNVFDNHSGVPGVETLVPVVLGQGLARGIPVASLVSVLATTPSRRFGLGTKGAIEPGRDADLVVFDPRSPAVVDGSRLHSNAGWSPYDGMSLQGRITHVLSRGEVVFDGELRSSAGRGRILEPEVG